MRVNFVVCPSYHGATLLALQLNNHRELSALGDTNPSREYDQTCSCGNSVSTCPFWTAVEQRLGLHPLANSKMYLPVLPWPLSDHLLEGGRVPITRNAAPNRTAGRIAAAAADLLLPSVWRGRSRGVSEYWAIWHDFYALVGELHGTSTIIDGTKSARKLALMARRPDLFGDVRVIHLVRDPRGFATSSLRYEPTLDVRACGWLWRDLHRRIERLASSVPYQRLRYEDLATQAATEMRSVFKFLGVPDEPVIGPPRFPHKHHLMGNAMLFRFDGRIELDERWRSELSAGDQETVMQLAGDTARRYGYS